MVVCWEPSVSQDIPPTPGRWTMHGTGLDDVSLIYKSSSISLPRGCKAHFWISYGKIADEKAEVG